MLIRLCSIILTTVFLLTPLWAQKVDTGEVPFKFIKNTIIIPVEIEGQEYWFVLDTGGGLMVSKQLQDRHGFKVVGETEVSDIGGNSKIFNRVLIPSLKIGAAQFKKGQALVDEHLSQYPVSCFQTDGMIGRDFLKKVILELDLSSGRFRISNKSSNFDLPQKYKSELRISDRGLPAALIDFGSFEKFIEFDSGSGDVFSFKTADVVANNQDYLPVGYQGIFSFGVSKKDYTISDRYRVKVDQMNFAGFSIKQFYSDLSKTTAPRIGAGLLRYGKIIVDYRNEDFYLIPTISNPQETQTADFGFALAFIEDDLIVKWVRVGSQAEQLGLKYGQKVVTLDGEKVDLSKRCEYYLNGFSYEKGDQVTITVQIDASTQKSFMLVRTSLP